MRAAFNAKCNSDDNKDEEFRHSQIHNEHSLNQKLQQSIDQASSRSSNCGIKGRNESSGSGAAADLSWLLNETHSILGGRRPSRSQFIRLYSLAYSQCVNSSSSNDDDADDKKKREEKDNDHQLQQLQGREGRRDCYLRQQVQIVARKFCFGVWQDIESRRGESDPIFLRYIESYQKYEDSLQTIHAVFVALEKGNNNFDIISVLKDIWGEVILKRLVNDLFDSCISLIAEQRKVMISDVFSNIPCSNDSQVAMPEEFSNKVFTFLSHIKNQEQNEALQGYCGIKEFINLFSKSTYLFYKYLNQQNINKSSRSFIPAMLNCFNCEKMMIGKNTELYDASKEMLISVFCCDNFEAIQNYIIGTLKLTKQKHHKEFLNVINSCKTHRISHAQAFGQKFHNIFVEKFLKLKYSYKGRLGVFCQQYFYLFANTLSNMKNYMHYILIDNMKLSNIAIGHFIGKIFDITESKLLLSRFLDAKSPSCNFRNTASDTTIEYFFNLIFHQIARGFYSSKQFQRLKFDFPSLFLTVLDQIVDEQKFIDWYCTFLKIRLIERNFCDVNFELSCAKIIVKKLIHCYTIDIVSLYKDALLSTKFESYLVMENKYRYDDLIVSEFPSDKFLKYSEVIEPHLLNNSSKFFKDIMQQDRFNHMLDVIKIDSNHKSRQLEIFLSRIEIKFFIEDEDDKFINIIVNPIQLEIISILFQHFDSTFRFYNYLSIEEVYNHFNLKDESMFKKNFAPFLYSQLFVLKKTLITDNKFDLICEFEMEDEFRLDKSCNVHGQTIDLNLFNSNEFY